MRLVGLFGIIPYGNMRGATKNRTHELDDAHTGGIEQFGHQAGGALQPREKGCRFPQAENHRQFRRALGADDLAHVAQRHLQDMFVEKDDGIERLILGR